MQLLPLAGLVPEGAGRGSFWGCPLELPRKETLLLPTHLRPPSNALTGRTNKPTKEKEFRVPSPAWESWSELRPSSFKTRPILPSGCSAPPAIHAPKRPATLRAFPQQDAAALHTKEDRARHQQGRRGGSTAPIAEQSCPNSQVRPPTEP